MLHKENQTNSEMPSQSRTLEVQSADTARGRHETGLNGRKASAAQPGRERRTRASGGVQHVFVLDGRGNPLMPTKPSRARELLNKSRAVAVRTSPFVIRLKDRLIEDSVVQPIRLGVDPGSKTTGMAISIEAEGVRHVLFKLEVGHRSAVIHKKMQQRAAYRRRRRSANLRYRAPRFNNRTKPKGWLAPSLRSRVQHVESWARRLQRWAPILAIDLELVRFDTQLMQDAEVSGVGYQHGTLVGYEVREYLLAKFGRRCVYCDSWDVPLNIDHVLARTRGGTDRVSNLVLACIPCNQRKDSQRIEDFCPARASQVLARAKAPLHDAAAVNSTRFATRAVLLRLGVPVDCSTGGRTKFNRHEYGIPKTHALDAACVGVVAGVRGWGGQTLSVQATGRGSHQRTRTDAFGFPRLLCPRSKRVHGFATGDLVRADVPKGKHAGVHVGRVAVRSTGSFRVGSHDGINHKHCTIVQRQDGYTHASSSPSL
jgi:5-methylcytosine-specific restriction endonuclease McrA